MSRRSRRQDESRRRQSGRRGPGRREPDRREPDRREPGRREPGRREPGHPQPSAVRGRLSGFGVQLILLAAVFALGVLVAELAGAADLGVALGVGQIAFAIALVYLLLRW